MSAWEPWATDAESFERACLAELKREFSHPGTARMMREPAGREFREVRLDGSYPETVIVVSFLNLRTGDVEELPLPLWEGLFRAGDGDMMLHPKSIAQDIWIMLTEP